MTLRPEKPSVAKGKAGLGKMFKELLESLKTGNSKEAFKKISAIVIAIFSGKLSDLKEDVEKARKEKETKEVQTAKVEQKPEKPEEAETVKTEPPAAKGEEAEAAKPAAPVAKINKAEFRQGDLFDALKKHCPYAEVLSGLKEFTPKPIAIKGIPGWKKGNKTDNWDYEKAGNTDELIEKGTYKVDSIPRPKGSTTKVPPATHQKLEQIAIALQHDPRMPLFTGIEMNVDGLRVTVIKEIHCTNRSQTKSRTIGQPHTGTSYFVKD